jgi:DNA topoisomerase IB
VGPRGERITSTADIDRIKQLAIPPAWTDVWISPHRNGHIQAIGVDQAGRRQYLYHQAWHAARSIEKFERARQLGRQIPRLRRRLNREIAGTHLTEQRVLSCAVRLLDLGVFRIGSEQYVKENDSYGLATVRRDHVRTIPEGVEFSYPAKSGQQGQQLITHPEVGKVLRQLLRRRDSSEELLAWWDPTHRRWVDVKSAHINEYTKSLAGDDFTAKDFRTWHASVLMGMHLSIHAAKSEALTRRRFAECYREVAQDLGNTSAVVRSSYVDPRVVDLAERGHTIPPVRIQRHELVPTAASRSLVKLLDLAESGQL